LGSPSKPGAAHGQPSEINAEKGVKRSWEDDDDDDDDGNDGVEFDLARYAPMHAISALPWLWPSEF
jgi:hypothetical protein